MRDPVSHTSDLRPTGASSHFSTYRSPKSDERVVSRLLASAAVLVSPISHRVWRAVTSGLSHASGFDSFGVVMNPKLVETELPSGRLGWLRRSLARTGGHSATCSVANSAPPIKIMNATMTSRKRSSTSGAENTPAWVTRRRDRRPPAVCRSPARRRVIRPPPRSRRLSGALKWLACAPNSLPRASSNICASP